MPLVLSRGYIHIDGEHGSEVLDQTALLSPHGARGQADGHSLGARHIDSVMSSCRLDGC
jgi:hypothetical protein